MKELPKEQARQIIKRHQEKTHYATWNWILLTIVLIVLGWFGFMKSINWINTHTIEKQRIFSWDWNWPLEIKEKEEPKVIEKVIEPATPDQVDTDVKKYACKVWGEFHCLTMIAVFQAESGWDNTKWHYNDNATLDYGLAQINSVNWKLEGCSLKEIVDELKNIMCAYKIWDRADGTEGNQQGSFSPWVVYQTDAYLSHL